MNAYEGILYTLRQRERELLNSKRAIEYNKNRPPIDRWYELKTPDFSEELVKNKIAVYFHYYFNNSLVKKGRSI